MPERRTPLYDNHLRLGAQMVRGGGDYLFPLSYTSPVEEHINTRTNVGMQDLSTMGEVDIKGPGAERLINQLLVNEIRDLEPGQVARPAVQRDRGEDAHLGAAAGHRDAVERLGPAPLRARARRTTLRIRASVHAVTAPAQSPAPCERGSVSSVSTASAAASSASVRAGGAARSTRTTSGSTYCGARSRGLHGRTPVTAPPPVRPPVRAR